MGDLVAFGRYEQDNNVSNGAEPIVWEILEIRDNDILVISQSAIDCQRYHAKYVTVTWQTSSIRQWLNGTFFNAAFSLEEQEQILTTDMKAAPNPWYDTEPGMDTQDRIFLLSIQEVKQYFPSDSRRMCAATPYAVNQGAYVNPATGCSWWWLRTPGCSSKDAASVNSDGTIDYDDAAVNTPPGTIRPIMWIRMG